MATSSKIQKFNFGNVSLYEESQCFANTKPTKYRRKKLHDFNQIHGRRESALKFVKIIEFCSYFVPFLVVYHHYTLKRSIFKVMPCGEFYLRSAKIFHLMMLFRGPPETFHNHRVH